jgi:hypothetical protein
MDKQWDPSTPIEDLWTQISKARNYAATRNNAITDTTALISATKNLQNTGIFVQAFKHWRAKDMVNQTYQNFMTHFNLANVNRLLTTTTAEAGYAATTNQPNRGTTSPKTNNKENSPRSEGSIVGYHYCWTHGVNRTHKGNQCTYPKDGHIKDATIERMQGGCVFIYQPVNKRRSRNPLAPTPAPPTVV